MDKLAVRVETPLQRPLVERAPAFAKGLKQAADSAPDRRVLGRCESVALGSCRDLPRRAPADVLEPQAAVADGKGGVAGLPPRPEAAA